MHQVENVERALTSTNISFFGSRHGAADHKIASIDKKIVEIQRKYFFGGVLSNGDAKKLLTYE